MQVAYPFRIDARGRVAETDDNQHIRDLIEEVLFTSPGERVNRPDFGSGVMQMVFMPSSDEISAATQFLVQGALQQWLGDLIRVNAVHIESDEATLRVTVQYLVLRTQKRDTLQFERSLLAV